MVLLIVDTQEMIVTKQLYQYEKFIQNVKKAIETARENDVEVVYIRHDDGFELTKGVDGFEIYEEFAPKQGEKIFDKHVNSAFKESGLLEYLSAKNEKSVMLAGLQTDYCIDATVKCGFEHGFEMLIPAYCNTTVDNEFMSGEKTYQYYNEKMWHGRYAKCMSLEEALAVMKN
ncbi:cysteine hydrolase family protein [Roseburia sp. 499]|uniref:cysteine hydrolase family protein n=1 Tax=Roseburia sp. 499 TaxID=1261634 RepID=UPI000953392F|nr:cysteine hydrolase family protein [Roseburia sp. 499]WVK70557.1 cysteine hydrolase family protein [Roseburia sp. 499]